MLAHLTGQIYSTLKLVRVFRHLAITWITRGELKADYLLGS